MRKHNFGYFFHEGLTNMFSHGFMSFAAIGITVACLLIMGTFTLVAVNADVQLKNLESENEILAYVDENYSEAEAQGLKSELESLPNVTSATYISKEEATKSFQSKYPDEQLFQDLDPTIFRDRFAIHIADLSKTSATVEEISNVSGIVKVNAYEEISNGMITVRNVATVVCLALILILFVVGFLPRNLDMAATALVSFACAMQVQTFRKVHGYSYASTMCIGNLRGGTAAFSAWLREKKPEELEKAVYYFAIMRMVGATNGFIRWPFVYEGSMIGILSATIAFFIQWGVYSAVARGVESSQALQLIDLVSFQTLWKPVAAVFLLAGILIGVGGSLSAIRRFLQA